mmetsp:Transcript_37497/g.36053  ORF Transcript_37497/g.36053 Transcript_37497/m.36053 type:complete len:91 (+) Transcript_37497:271-543(+)
MIEEAIDQINNLNPEILDSEKDLYFDLKKQQLVELIRVGKTEEAIDFAQKKIASECKGKNAIKYQEEVEKVMTLLMYEDPAKSPMKELIE